MSFLDSVVVSIYNILNFKESFLSHLKKKHFEQSKLLVSNIQTQAYILIQMFSPWLFAQAHNENFRSYFENRIVMCNFYASIQISLCLSQK